MMKITKDGMVRRLVWKVLNPRDFRIKVRYAVGGVNGISHVKPMR
jgi:hypothetical protein